MAGGDNVSVFNLYSIFKCISVLTTSPDVSFSYIGALGGSFKFIWLRETRVEINKPSGSALYRHKTRRKMCYS